MTATPPKRHSRPECQPQAPAARPVEPELAAIDPPTVPAPAEPIETSDTSSNVPEPARETDEPTRSESSVASTAHEGLRDATLRRPPAPRYPRRCVRRRQEGVVVLRVRVLADGSVDKVSVVKSSGVDLLDAEAVRAMKRARFRPARRNGEPVVAWVTQPVRFLLRS